MRAKKSNYLKYAPYVVLGILIALLAVLYIPTFASITGLAFFDVSYDINIIAVEDGAGADVIIAAAEYARGMSISEVLLTSELTGAEEHVLILQGVSGEGATITQEGSNIVVDGDIALAFGALDTVLTDADYSTATSVSIAADGLITILEEDNDVFDPVDDNQGTNLVSLTIDVENCDDTDGGIMSDLFGTVMLNDGQGHDDSCMDEYMLIELYCGEDVDGYEYVAEEYVDCAFGCADGHCLPEDEIVVESMCGDGIIDAAEACDDGNIIEGDGCSALCQIENCIDTGTGVDVSYPNSYYDYDTGEYSTYEYHYDDECYYYDYYGAYYYYDYICEQSTWDNSWYATTLYPMDVCESGCEDGVGCVDVETVEPYCDDPDGSDEYTLGTTTNVNKFGEETVQVDECYSYNDNYHYVMEGYCYEYNDVVYLSTEYISCDGVCEDGVCVEGVEPTCTDSDETDIYAPQDSSFVLGEVTGTDRSGVSFVNVDECYDSYGYGYVVEWYCYDDTYNDIVVPYSTYTYCQGGCEDGVCLEPDYEQSCVDSDETADNAGKDLGVKGGASGIDYYGNDFVYEDYCYDSYDYYTSEYVSSVIDYYCVQESSWGPYATSYYEVCPEGCTDGACIVPEIVVELTCQAGEGYVMGTDQYGEYTNYDYCNGAAELVSYSCGESADGAPYVATATACNCMDSQCHEASMTVAQFVSQVNPVIVIGASAATEDNIAAIDLASATGWKVVTDATIDDYTTEDIVAIGGPYANKASAKAMGGQTWDYGIGEALFVVKEYDNSGVTLVVSGSEAVDTRNAVKILANNPSVLDYSYGVERVS
jgi:cysteine-rich repeat protein